MASMRDIKRRRGSIQSTQQITKAMKLVSTVKLQRAKANAEKTKEYFTSVYETVASLVKKAGNVQSPFLTGNGSEKKAVIVVTSNRGLAGGYNANIVKLLTRGSADTEASEAAGWNKEDVVIYAVGKKGRDTLARHGYEIALDMPETMEAPMYADAMQLGKEVLSAYAGGEIGELWLAYTSFKNTVSHVPTLLKLLPVDTSKLDDKESTQEKKPQAIMNFEPPAEEALAMLIPKYINSQIYGGLMQAAASENAARMQAMDSATSNAEEMIEALSLQYNRARQGSITQELTEIIAGAEAIS